MSLCCGSAPSLGLWNIYVKVPVYVAPKVRWKWSANSEWNEISPADFYTVSEEDSQLIENVRYRITVEGQCRSRSIQIYTITITAPIYQFKVINAGTIPSPNFNLVVSHKGSTTRCRNVISSTQSEWIENCSTVFSCGILGVQSWRLINIVRLDNGQPPPKIYRLKIFNGSQLVKEETGSNPPIVEVIPERCETPTEPTFVRQYQNLKQGDYCGTETGFEVGKNQAFFFLFSNKGGNPPQFRLVLLAFAESDSRCPRPEFIVECIPCKRCPESSCAMICGDSVCCYDQVTGELVDSFAFEEYC